MQDESAKAAPGSPAGAGTTAQVRSAVFVIHTHNKTSHCVCVGNLYKTYDCKSNVGSDLSSLVGGGSCLQIEAV